MKKSCERVTTLARKYWLTKCACSVRSWRTGLLAICMALLLSRNKDVGGWMWTPKSYKMRERWIVSIIVMDLAQYSTSILKRETTSCFFLFQKIREMPRKMQWPIDYIWWVREATHHCRTELDIWLERRNNGLIICKICSIKDIKDILLLRKKYTTRTRK